MYNTYLLSFFEGVVSQVEVVGGILRLAVHSGLEVQMGRGGATRLAYEGYHLPGLHVLTYLHLVLGVVSVVGLEAVGVLDAYQITIAGELTREHHLTVEGGIDLVLGLCLEVDARMLAPATLAVRADHFCPWQWEAPLFRSSRTL